MPKTKFKTGGRITFELSPEHREKLISLCNSRGLAVSSFCRVQVIEILNRESIKNDNQQS
jgi:hypothetical protein